MRPHLASLVLCLLFALRTVAENDDLIFEQEGRLPSHIVPSIERHKDESLFRRIKRQVLNLWSARDKEEQSNDIYADQELEQKDGHRKVFETDDEDLASSGEIEGSAGSSGVHAIVHRPSEAPKAAKTFKYYRIEFTMSEPFREALLNRNNEEHRSLSYNISQSFEDLFKREFPDDFHNTNVVKLAPTSDSFTVHVTLDLGTTVSSDEAIRRLLENQMRMHHVGSVSVPQGDFTFRNFQDAVRSDDRPECEHASQLRCNTGHCVPLGSRCNGTSECDDGSDELGCPAATPQFGRANLTTNVKPYPEIENICRGDDVTLCRDRSRYICYAHECDGITHCNDGSDEENCYRQSECKSGEFACDVTRCILESQRCDFVEDCNDGSDEHDCNYPACSHNQFRCRSGQCIENGQRCNGIPECHDRSDELNCPCRDEEFECTVGYCISKARLCDGYADCQNNLDEQNCSDRSRCRQDEFTCLDGSCIGANARCDGRRDCVDYSDERDCNVTTCNSDQFRCNDGICLSIDKRCNEVTDCRAGEDEENCACKEEGQKLCDNGVCISQAFFCDGNSDCLDNSDEKDCKNIKPAKPPYVCQRSDFTCHDRTCVPHLKVCDGVPDCPDGSDESECFRGCKQGQFQCSNGDCIQANQQCNRVIDCDDGSDEDNCASTDNQEEEERGPGYHPMPGHCPHGRFRCNSDNSCVPHSARCNGIPECRDASDERDCGDTTTHTELNLKTYPSEQVIKESREVVFQCRDEGPLRARVRWLKDGQPLPAGSRDLNGRLEIPNIQIADAGDYICEAIDHPRLPNRQVRVHLVVERREEPLTRPPLVCKYEEATCSNGDCIPKNQICDGKYDCTDGSDEMRCSLHGCEPNEFRCANKQCISKIWRCDGDKDCVDGSDEENCAQAPIGSPCRYGEFQCHSRSQCIPKSYHCDSERDCFDGSDELGCMAVSIVKSPPPMIYLNQYDTLELSCTAIGVPTPEINYRLNWGHVPSKCKIQSQNGTGTLTCPEITFSDQGAYSCEAINIIGFTFAVPDTILMVKQPESVCPRGTFNSEAKSPEECISCFCFGATNNCTSANLFTYQLPPPFDSYRMVQVETFPRIRLIWNNTEGSVVEILPFGRDGVRAYDRYYSNTNYTVPYFVLPESHHGSQLKSYGGYLRYTLKFNGTRTLNTAPAVILSGNGLTLVHKGGQVSPGYSNEESVRLFEGEWYKVEGRYEEPASREEIMMALANVENILIKLKYDDEQLLDTALINIVMDTADVTNTGLGAASFVEECSCPTGYSGDSCERCAPGFIRQKTGAWLGHCAPESPIVCPPGHFGDPSRNIPCKLCPCPLTNPSNQFARTCHLGSDGNPTCDCPVGYDGRRCEKCAPDYRGNPLMPGDMCVLLGPQCDPRGSLSSSPDPLTGRCRCKAHATGSICDQCKANTFSLATSNQFGCLSCFCMGITTTCSASNWFRNEIKVSFTNSVRNFSIIESTHPNARPIDHNIQLDSVNREIVYSEFPNRGDGNVYYWQLPSIFLGDQIASYGGFLKYTIRYVPSPGGLSSKNNAADVEIISANDRTLLYYSQESPNPNVPTPFEVPLLEQYWQRTDGTPIDRENLLMTLADIQTVRIKATYTTHTAEAALSRVSLDTAEKWNTGKGRAVEVEECSCPLGYKGLSCEDCDTGYSRIAMGIHLGMCEPCNCNGHSNQCNPETGVCENCAHHTMGPNCELCEPGYQGNATRGTPSDCSYAPGNAPGRHTECYCDLAGSRSTSCENNKCDCKRNVVGERCNRCRPDTFGLSASNPDGCNECFCNGLTNQCHESSLYLQQIPMIVYDDSHGFILTDSSRREIINQDFELNIALSRIGYRYPRGRSSARLFWSLSSSFTGNKVKSYGGNLSITQQISTNENARIYQDQDVILIGNGVTLFWMNPVAIESGVPLVYKVSLREGDWRRLNNEGHRTASRADLMTVLSNLEAILVRATFSDEMTATYISDVSMDTAVDTKTGLQRATQVEICRCPQGYTGTSCESCSRGYYRDISDRSHSILGVCKPCPCNGKEESCEMNRHGHVVCHCSRGSAGANCEEAEGLTVKPLPSGGSAKIHITIREPEFQIVEVGSTVRYHCSGTSVDNTAVNVRWNKEGGPLPSDRSMDDNHGLLIIRDLKVTDSGVYVCEVSDGVNIGLKRVSLTVGGTHAEAPRATINPSSIEVREGDPVEMHCVATGHPAPVLEWVRVHGRINPEANFYNGVWRLPYALKSDAAEYICIARNNIGVHEERTILYVRDGPKRPDTSSLSLRPTISPSEWTGPAGQSVYLSCSGSNMTKFAWSRLGGISLQRTASERYGVLTITNPSVSDSGIYVCTATSSENTETSSTARVTIVPPTETPIIKAMPERQTVPQGSTAEIRCADAFRNNFTVKWWRFGATSLRPNVIQVGESLRISNIQMEDRGVYVCTASNDRNTVETSATVEVDYREPPALEVYPRDVQTVYPGGSADMQCRATAGQPAPEVYWTREDGRSFHSNVEQLPGGLLRIRNVSLEDEGGYVCTATNPVGTVATVARIQVHSPPVVSIDPDREVLQVRLGQKVRLVCSATGRPVPNVAWTKHTHGSSMHEPFNRLATIPHSAVQEIVSVSLDDEGYYTCEGTNAAGTDTRRIEIRIEEDQDNTIDEQEPCRGDVPCPSEPQINAPDNDRGPSTNIVAIDEYKIPEGGTVEMRCRATGNGSDAFYLDWKRSNSRSLPQGSLISEGTLKISHVTKDAAGEYECLGVDQLGVVLFRAVSELVVISPPRIILHPPSQTVGPGENPYIQCSASGDQPIHIEWIAVGRASPITKSYNGILQFHSITFEDAGKYVCKARNEAGTAEAVAEVLVNDSDDFKNIHATEHDVSTIAGSSVRLTCRSQGPEINWSREGQSLPASHRTGEDYLELVHVRPEDSGRYICQIRNSQGVESRDYINLRVSAASSPYVTVKSSHDFANIGDTVDLNCQSYGTHNPRYHWIRENRLPLPSRSTVHGHNLRISNLEPNDGGNYICLVQSAENRYEGIYNLVVQDTSLLSSGDAPAIDVKTVKLGEQAVLECTAELKRPKKFEWRTNKDLPSSSKISNGNLIIRNVTEHEAGNYICVASNDQDSVEGPVVLVVTDVIPHFSQSQSYLELAPLMEHHLSFNIEVSFRPESFDGIILYEDEHVNGTGDFLMLALERAYPIMKFNLGSETATIKSNKSLELNKWHTIKLQRFKKEGIMLVDGQHQFTGTAEGKKYRLDLKESLFVGGVPHNRIVHKDVSVRTSMLGCISRIVSSDRVLSLMANKVDSYGLTSCESCDTSSCMNEGVCQPASTKNGYRCLCRAGFYGDLCENVGETCYPGACGEGKCVNTDTDFTCYCPLGKRGRRCEQTIGLPHLSHDKAFMSYKTPNDSRKLKFELSFKPDDDLDCILMYCAQNEEGLGDFIAVVIRDKHVELRFDMGSGLAVVRSDYTIQAGSWTHVVITKDYKIGSVSVNRETPVEGKSPGNARVTFLMTPLYIGGVDRLKIHLHRHTGTRRGFRGCFSELILLRTDNLKSPMETVQVDDCAAESTTELHNACMSAPCVNGMCQPNHDFRDYSCMCNYGYVGRNCEKILKQCEMLSPCKNGGSCYDLHGSYRCDCRLGYDGMDCENLAKIECEASFRGDGWLELDRSVMLHDEEKEVFGLEIATNRSNGLILWHGQNPDQFNPDDFVAVAVVDGYVEYQYNLGSGPAVIRVTAQRVDDGSRHRIVLKREGSDGSIELNGEHTESGMSDGLQQILNTKGNVFLGGVPDYGMTFKRYSEGFSGCIYSFEVGDSRAIDLGSKAARGKNVSPCSRRGRWNPSSLVFTDADPDTFDAFVPPPPVNIIHPKPSAGVASSRTLNACTILTLLVLARIHQAIQN